MVGWSCVGGGEVSSRGAREVVTRVRLSFNPFMCMSWLMGRRRWKGRRKRKGVRQRLFPQGEGGRGGRSLGTRKKR